MGWRKRSQQGAQQSEVNTENKNSNKLIYFLCILTLLTLVSIFASAIGYSKVNNNIEGLTGQIKNIDSSVKGLEDNSKFSNISNEILGSVVVIISKPAPNQTTFQTDAIYVDSSGVNWRKGAGFAIGDGVIITAKHVVDGATEIRILYNGVDTNATIAPPESGNLDVALLKTNLNIQPVVLDDRDLIPVGSKVAFIGFPLSGMPYEVVPILHQGIISSYIGFPNKDNKYVYKYTINSFLNRGNSGGPVFLADSGKVIGVIYAREPSPINMNIPEKSDASDEYKAITAAMRDITTQLAANSQMGIGYAIGLNKNLLNIPKQS